MAVIVVVPSIETNNMNDDNEYLEQILNLPDASPNRGVIKSTPPSKKQSVDIEANMEMRYKKAYTTCYNRLPRWKQVAVNECRAINKANDSLYEEFVKEVVALAESNQLL